MVYARVDNGTVVEVGPAPKSYNKTSNFLALSDTDKKSQGWYKVIASSTDPEVWQTYTSTYTYNSGPDTVTESRTMTSLSLADYKLQRINELKNECTQDIYRLGSTVMKQRNAAMGVYDASTNASIISTVTTQKAIVDAAEVSINAATDHAGVKAVYYANHTYDANGVITATSYWGD